MAANLIGHPFTNMMGTPVAKPSTASNIPSKVLPPAFPAFLAPIIPEPVCVESARWADRMAPEPRRETACMEKPAWKRCAQGEAKTPESACPGRALFSSLTLFLSSPGRYRWEV